MALNITVLGSGASFGTPVVSCHCPVCESDNPRNRRLRPSIFVETATHKFLVDCGPDFRRQALRTGIEQLDAVFFTHNHADHICGVDDLRIFNYRTQKAVDVYCDELVETTLRRSQPYFFEDGLYESGANVMPMLNVIRIEQPVQFGELRITPVPVLHGDLPILGFRFNDFAYLTDCKTIPPESWKLLEGLDVLMLNALRYKSHPVHLSLDEAIELAGQLQPRQTFLTHMTHEIEHEAANQTLPENCALAYDGQLIELA